ncbi:MAG TPA: tyrosine-type recombinase/integrase [Gammaproteobacteria bacterium]|nr:tyrosine-type recombinase/integrase [Gammaproteobacteria bacterium]
MAAQLIKRGNTFHAKLNIPTRQAQLIGRRQVWRALKDETGKSVTSKVEADRLFHRTVADMIDEVEDAVSRALGVDPTAPTPRSILGTAAGLHQQVQAGELDEDTAAEILEDYLERMAAGRGAAGDTPIGDIPGDIRRATRAASARLAGTKAYTLEESITDYLRDIDVAPRTLKLRTKVLADFLNWTGPILLSDITRDLAGRYVSVVREDGRAPTTQRQAIRVLSTFTRWCSLVGRPLGDLEPFRSQAGRIKGQGTNASRPWTSDQLALLERFDPSDIRYIVPVLLLYTGCRREEVCQIKPEDVDLEARSIAIYPDGGGKTASASRTVPIHRDLLPLLKYLLEHPAEDGYLLPLKADSDGLRGPSIGSRWLEWCTARKLSGRDRPQLHGLRKSFADLCEQSDMPDNARKRILGHSLRGMDGVYLSKRYPLERLIEAVDKLEFPLAPRVPS